MCPPSSHEKCTGKCFRGSLSASTLRNYFCMQTSMCLLVISCHELQVTDIFSLHKCMVGDKNITVGFNSPPLDIRDTDGQQPSWLHWLPLRSMARHSHFQGAVHLTYSITLLRMKWVMPYNCLFLSTGYRQVKKCGLDSPIQFLRYPPLTRRIQPKESLLLWPICQEYIQSCFFLHLHNLKSMLFPKFSVTPYSRSRRLGRGRR